MDTDMKTSAAGRAAIASREGCILTAYRDSAGVLTIGVGHTTAAGEPKVTAPMKITAAQADEILSRDLAGVETRRGRHPCPARRKPAPHERDAESRDGQGRPDVDMGMATRLDVAAGLCLALRADPAAADQRGARRVDRSGGPDDTDDP